MTTVVAWSRILADREIVCAINTDTAANRSAWVTIDSDLHGIGDTYVYSYSSDPAAVGTTTAVEARNGRAIRVSLPPGGVAVVAPQ
jgi:hypothetical protein